MNVRTRTSSVAVASSWALDNDELVPDLSAASITCKLVALRATSVEVVIAEVTVRGLEVFELSQTYALCQNLTATTHGHGRPRVLSVRAYIPSW